MVATNGAGHQFDPELSAIFLDRWAGLADTAGTMAAASFTRGLVAAG